MNDAVERAIKSWEGQIRTIRDHAEGEIGELRPDPCDASSLAAVRLVGLVDSSIATWWGRMGVRRMSSSLATKASC